LQATQGLRLGGTNFGYLNAHSLQAALEHLSSCGASLVELGLAAPHFDLAQATGADVRSLRSTLERRGLTCTSVNAAELNLISQNAAVGELAVAQCTRLIQVAAEIGAPYAVIVPGRQHPLRPTPEATARALFDRRMDVILAVAERVGVGIALETVPFGFLQRAGELAAWIRGRGHASLSMVVDCANVFMVEDPAQAIVDGGDLMTLCHVSDAWKTRWAHTSIGRGEIDFHAIVASLQARAFRGVTIYELMDADDPVPRLAGDFATLEACGWSRAIA
jgi:sugar phosphate isomerase/epimerase